MPLPLSARVKAELFRNVELHVTKNCDQIVSLHPDRYGGEYLSAARNRYHYLKRLKRDNPEAYWRQHSAATLFLQKNPVDTPAPAPAPVQQQGPATIAPTNTETATTETNIASPPRRVTRSSAAAATTQPPFTTTATTTARSPPGRTQGRTPVQNMANYRTPGSNFGGFSPGRVLPTRAARLDEDYDGSRRIFQTLEEATESVDHVVHVDFAFPEKHGQNLLIQRFDGSLILRFPFATYKEDCVKIAFQHFIDVRDYSQTTGHIVLNGTGFLITTPSVPFYLLYNHQQMYAKFPGCPSKVKEDHSIWANAVKKNPSRLMSTILCVMPKGVVITSDVWSPEPAVPAADKKVKLKLGELSLSFNASKQMAHQQTVQTFLPAFWNVRVLSNKPPQELEAEELENEDDLCNAFDGMLQPKANNATGSSYF